MRAARLDDVRAAGRTSVRVAGHSLALFFHDGRVHALDNRCPHMGFPLHRGTLQDGILTCHWHHARFDLESGGTFDQFADEARVFPVEIRDGEVWVDLSPREDRPAYLRQRLRDGLERNISLVVSKSAIGLLGSGEDPAEPFRVGLEFGSRYRRAGWGQGLTMHTCMMNLCLTWLPRTDHGPSTTGSPPSHGTPPGNRHASPCVRCPPRRWTWPRSGSGSDGSSRCATQKGPNAASSLRCAQGRIPPRWQICSSLPPPTTATWIAGTSWTSPTRLWKHSTSPDGRMPRSSSPAWPKDMWVRGAWRSRTPGATPWIWYRYSRPPSSSCRTLESGRDRRGR